MMGVDSLYCRYDYFVSHHIAAANAHRTYDTEAHTTTYSLAELDELFRSNKYRLKSNTDLAPLHDATSVILCCFV